MRPNPRFALDDADEIKRVIRENPWSTLVTQTTAGLVASHYPILVDESRDGLSIVTHFGRPDDQVHELGEHELLVIVQGPHGYVSPSWYGDRVDVPTWNFITVHLSGVPERLDGEENLSVLARLVDHFEDRVPTPRRLNGTPADSENAQRLSRGTVGVRLTPARIAAKRKMSQNKPPEIVERVIGELEGHGPYASPALAREMRFVHRVLDQG